MGKRYLTMLAEQAENGKMSSIAGAFTLSLVLLILPIMILILRSPPHELFGRYYGVDFSIFEGFAPEEHDIAIQSDDAGFITSVRVGPDADGLVVVTPGGGVLALFKNIEDMEGLPEEAGGKPVFGISDEFFFFADKGTQLLTPVGSLPRTVLDEWNVRELFNYLALNNSWFSRFMFPAMLLVVAIAIFMVLGFYLIIAAIFGMTRIMSHKMPMGKRVRALMVCSYPSAILSCLVGFIMPVMHLFVFQLLLIFIAFGVSKRI